MKHAHQLNRGSFARRARSGMTRAVSCHKPGVRTSFPADGRFAVHELSRLGGKMSGRLNFVHAAPEAFRAMRALQTYANGTGLEPLLQELVKLRASYMNGCAYCVDMHSKD